MSSAIQHSLPVGNTAWRRQYKASPCIRNASHLHGWCCLWRAYPNLRQLSHPPAATSATSNSVSGGSVSPSNGIMGRGLGVCGHGLGNRRAASTITAARNRSTSSGGSSGQEPDPDADTAATVEAAAATAARADREGSIGGGGGGAAVAVADSMIGRVEDTELYDETYKSYLSYAMSVIVSRAIPDVRDGLKPVHRRILYAMHELGLAHNKPFKKCARVVGEVLGKFHPHGDTAVYDSLVRMAQFFSMRQPLVDGHGNFGSLDDDPAAAMRYTECRLTRAAGESLLRDLGRDTVDWQPTFDESQSEPLVLPAVAPNLLVNGSAGIAVGLASNIPPHNLGEVVAALRALISDPWVSTEQLMQHVRGPDFPTGGEIVVGPELLQAYDTGKGSVVVRGKATVERLGGGGGAADDGAAAAVAAVATGRGRRRRGAVAATATYAGEEGPAAGRREQIVISELPYQVFKSDLVAAIAELIESKQLEGASDVRDESDRTGVRVVVDVKKGHSGEAVLAQLYKSTKLQVNFNFNCMSLHNMKPRLMGLKAMLEAFLDFRCEVVQRRSSAALLAARQRLHLVQGFLRLLEEDGRLDAVVADVRVAADGAAARRALVSRHDLSEDQAEAILGLTLRRLTGLEAAKLEQERVELQQTITRLQNILASRTALLAVVEQEAAALAEAHPDPRRTALVAASDIPVHPDPEDLRPSQSCLVLASRRGFLRRLPDEALALQNRNTRGKSGIRLRGGDFLAALTSSSDRDMLLLLTPDGKMFKTRVASVPAAAAAAGSTAMAASQASTSGVAASAGPSGASVANVLKIPESFPIAAIVPVPAGLLPAAVVPSSPCGGSSATASPAASTEQVADGAPGGDANDEDAEIQGGGDDSGADAEAAQGPCLVLCSRQGLIKRLPLRNRRDRKKGITVMGIGSRTPEGTEATGPAGTSEELGWAALSSSPRDVVVLASAEGQVLMFPASDVRILRPQSGGVQALRISKRRHQDRIADMIVLPADRVPLLGMQLPAAAAAAAGDDGTAPGSAAQGSEDGGEDEEVEEDTRGELELHEQQERDGDGPASGPAGPCLLIVTAHGIGKRIPLGQLRLGTRRQAGVLAIRVSRAERARRSRSSGGATTAAAAAPTTPVPSPSRGPDRVVAVLAVRDGEEVVMASRNGVVVRQSVDGIAVQGRITRGTFVMQLDDGDEVVDISIAPPPAASSTSTLTSNGAAERGVVGRAVDRGHGVLGGRGE
ncbi:hypothetical protein VaNZ11_015993 [Volvox africanus]|uniref:DNA topoisomerase (ATP-hydrolyzing) n=1 Tax=Volvox africanus TaxID=51714 RepID=A0ABQ5SNG0_9CHLO|nr:hypothetical protein VaNZ11_015993 [Volvox africanus]